MRILARNFFSGAIPTIAAMLLTGCEVPQICHACLNSDPNQPVSPKLYHKIDFDYGSMAVPLNADNLYYYEECGIDCSYYAVFQLPHADAIKFAEDIRPLKSDAEICWNFRKKIEGSGIGWWPPKITKTSKMSCGDINIKNDRHADVALEKGDIDTKVYVYSWTM